MKSLAIMWQARSDPTADPEFKVVGVVGPVGVVGLVGVVGSVGSVGVV